MLSSNAVISWVKKNYGIIVTLVGGYALYRVVTYFDEDKRGENLKIIKTFTKYQQYPLLFHHILEGESETYEDMNYYKGDTLSGYIKGKYGKRYGGMTKDLTDYTIGEVIAFQNNSRSSANGQLWATGRYQVIPSTLKGIYASAGLTLSDKYSPENQDKIGMALLRTNTKKFLQGTIANTQANKNASALEIAQTWSSVGVPYDMRGMYQNINKNDSYYKRSGGIDKASVKTEDIQKALVESRKK